MFKGKLHMRLYKCTIYFEGTFVEGYMNTNNNKIFCHLQSQIEQV